MNICLIFPPSSFLIDDHAMPPLGIMYLAAVAKGKGANVVMCDNVRHSTIPKGMDLYGISMTTPQYREAVRILNDIKIDNPDSWVIAGGPHATVMPEDCVKVGFDQVVRGEGERVIADIIDGDKRPLIEMKYYDQDEMHLLPLPDRECIDLYKYKYFIDDIRCTTMITQRGCPYGRCAFCCQVWKGTRYIPAHIVDREIQEIKSMGFRAVTIFDDIFFTMPERDIAIMSSLERANMIWRALCRSNIVVKNKDLIYMAGDYGCKEIALGIESAHIDILRRIRKGVSIDTHKRAIDIIRSCGIKAKLNCIVGLPGESHESIDAMDKFLEEIKPDWVDVTCLSVFPGSDIWNNPAAYDVKYDCTGYLPYKTIPGQYHCGVETSRMTSEEILAARDYLEKKHRPPMK